MNSISRTMPQSTVSNLVSINPNYKYLYDVTTFLTFAMTLIFGLSLTASGTFKDLVGLESDSIKPKLHFKLQFSSLLGVLMSLYSLLGFYLICVSQLRGKVSYTWIHELK